MKISNETKVGAIAVVVITVLILGFNFLKGNRLFSKSTVIFGKYDNINGLTPSNPILINGLQVGSVEKISADKNMRELVVSFTITRDINIPKNSIALIVPNPLSTTRVEIKLGDSKEFLKNNDYILTDANSGLLDDVMKRVDPVLFEVKNAVRTLDTLLTTINKVVDKKAKENISNTLDNINRISASMLISTASLEMLLNNQTGALAKTLNNVNAITGNLASNNEKINGVISNLDKTTANFSRLDLQKTLSILDTTINEFRSLAAKLNNEKGTLGLMLNDPSLYRNLASTGNKLNLLLDDIRVNPKRYVSISVFGKKQNVEPLMLPLPDTVSSPYIIKKAD